MNRPIVAVLGCSFSDPEFTQNYKSWSHYLAEDNPHVDVVNFAKSGHGFDYNMFVLKWMLQASYKPSLIIMNIPPMIRKFTWDSKDFKFDSEHIIDFFNIVSLNDNLYKALPNAAKIIYSNQVVRHDDRLQDPQQFTDIFQAECRQEFERHAYTVDVTAMNNLADIATLPIYEQLLDCKIYHYAHVMHKSIWTYKHYKSNFKNQHYPFDYIPKVYYNENVFIDDAHFSSRGNELFYTHYIKANSEIQEKIRNLS
jgi:hypothetical protein